MYAKVETHRRLFKINQNEIRSVFFFFLLEIPSELYKGIIDGIKLGETEGSKVGKTVFYQLPLLVVLEICAKDIWML